MTTRRGSYIIIIFLYLFTIVMWFYKDEIAFKAVGVDPTLIEKRSLTNKEFDLFNMASKVERKINKAVVIISALFFIVSLVYLKMQWFSPAFVLKISIFISAVFTLILLLGYMIRFVPMAPIT